MIGLLFVLFTLAVLFAAYAWSLVFRARKRAGTSVITGSRRYSPDNGEPIRVPLTAPAAAAGARIPDAPAFQPLPLQSRAPDEPWVPPGGKIIVQGFVIQEGMIYVGSNLPNVRGYGVEPALIDPSEPVDLSAADCHARCAGYWPSYDRITPAARASYLQWLATGKCDPEADLGYVFLYFYGLERRALSDAAGNPQAKAELPAIEREVQRLDGIYGKQRSFHAYARAFLDYLAAGKGVTQTLDQLPAPRSSRGHGLNLELRIGLALHARAGRPLSAPWALAWYLSVPDFSRRQTVVRCPDVFAALFNAEFGKRFGEGLKLPVNKTRIKVTCRPASASFAGGSFTVDLHLPEVSVLSGPVKKLQELGDVCCTILDPYVRFLGAHPQQAELPEARQLLSECLGAAETAALRLDSGKIAALRADSAKVAVLLGDVFAGEDADSAAPPEFHGEDMEATLLQLDSDHAGLLRVLLQRVQWSRAEVEEVCADRGLMIDGAIERINDAAFERYDRALIEGDDPLEIKCELMPEAMA
jgi:hypothetical protein